MLDRLTQLHSSQIYPNPYISVGIAEGGCGLTGVFLISPLESLWEESSCVFQGGLRVLLYLTGSQSKAARGGQKTGMDKRLLSIWPAGNEKHLLCEAVGNILALLFLSLSGRRDVGNEA